MQDGSSVLLIDDDLELCAMLDSYLTRHGWTVEAAHNGQDGIRAAKAGSPGLIILDGMLPDMDGFDVLRRIRTTDSVPVLLLTARGEEVDRIVGLEMGADDYIGKPFNPRELLARLRAIQRRSGAREEASANEAQQQQDFLVDESKRIITFRKKPLALTDIEYRLMAELVRQSPAVVDRDELTQRVLDRPARPFDRSLDVHVSRIRRKLDSLKDFKGTIRSIRNAGYLLVLDGDGEERTQ